MGDIMDAKTVSITYERKFNTGNYESMAIGVTLWADVDLDPEGETSQEVLDALTAQAKEHVRKTAMPVLKVCRLDKSPELVEQIEQLEAQVAEMSKTIADIEAQQP